MTDAVALPATDRIGVAQRLSSIVPGLAAVLLVAWLGIEDGGYFPTAWGPLTLGFLGVSAVALAARSRPRLGKLELAIPALLAALTFWTLFSTVWGSPSESVPEAQRVLAFASGSLAFALVLERHAVPSFLTGLWAGICVVCLYALSARLFPERVGVFDPIAGYRLSEPVGYWNALGLLAALGVVLALGLAARARVWPVRALAAASLVPLALTLYFTFSRGAWLALAAGLLAAIAIDSRRVQVVTHLVLLAPWPTLAVWLASRSDALTQPGFTVESASAEGHAVAAIAAALALTAAASAVSAAALETRVHAPTALVRASGPALAVIVVVLVVSGAAVAGGPSRIAQSFSAAPKPAVADLNERLFSLSGNGRVDSWRIALDDASAHPLLGSGAGSYERHWLAQRPYEESIRDAHSLYLETLAELGPIGLALVLAVLGVPLAAAVRLRESPLVPVAAGMLVAYLVHAGFDWDWEFPVLTLVALAGAAAIVAARDEAPAMPHRWRRLTLVAAVLALVPLAALGALGAHSSAASAQAADSGDFSRAAAEARRAERLAPWSVEPLLLLGRAQALARERAAARTTFRRALRREPGFWRLWLELAAVSTGPDRAVALREARALNPLEDLIQELERGS